jgi:curved DNA-binding protein CbpA
LDDVRRDPHRVLGVPPNASAEQLHDAYRRLVKQHHPDHNGGTPEATQRFQEIQEAYDELRNRPAPSRPAQAAWDSVADRMEKLESELREAQAARERARAAARQAARDAEGPTGATAPAATEDSFSRILGDVRDELGDRLKDARKHPAVQRVSDLIDGLDDLASRLDRK